MPDPAPSRKSIYRFIVCNRTGQDPRSAGLLSDAHALGFERISRLECRDLFFIEGNLTDRDALRLGTELLSDPVTQSVEWVEMTGSGAESRKGSKSCVEVALRPGVTDLVAEEIVRAAREMHIHGVERASTGFRYVLTGKGLSKEDLHLLASRLVANVVIHRYAIGTMEPSFPTPAQPRDDCEVIPVRGLDAAGLAALATERRTALDLAEMQAIQGYFQERGRDPTDVELECIAQTWSEHCIHRTFKAVIKVEPSSGEDAVREEVLCDYPGLRVDNLMKTYLRAATDQIHAPWVRSAFLDNAGIIDLDGKHEVSFKVETHNHPSAIEPFGGANTGTGGVIRDVIGVSAKPIAATDVLCFGPQEMPLADLPEGVLHPRRIMSGVVAGVQDYGNKIGLPTVSGAILFDPGYTSNPLVFCGCVGIAPRDRHPRQPQPGDRVIVIGGRTGRDGLRGATFSSQTMDAQTGEVAGASVQIGAPIVEKGLIEVVLKARDAGLYHAVTDCGAGGLSSAVGEMANEVGAQVDLARVKLKYPGLLPWEVWLSEAQERMVLAVPGEAVSRLRELCETYEVEMTDIGVFTGGANLVVCFGEKVVLDLANGFLHEGMPQRRLAARIPQPVRVAPQTTHSHPYRRDYDQVLLALLRHPNIASKESVIRIYDHEVQGGTVIKPLVGVKNDGPSDACVLKPAGVPGKEGIILSNGINPEYGKLDPYRMANAAIDEAVRNAVAVGANPDRLAILDNFCWGDPTSPETLGALLEAGRGCYDAAVLHRTPFISGKDSLNNEYTGSDGKRHAIPPTLLISAIGVVEDATQTISMDLKQPGNPLILVGEMRPRLGGCHLNLVRREQQELDEAPEPSSQAPEVYRRVHRAIRSGWVRACHDLSEGGLAVAAAEMCIGGRLGMDLLIATDDPSRYLFGETNGCLLVEVDKIRLTEFNALFRGLPTWLLGDVTSIPLFTVLNSGKRVFSIEVEKLVAAWQNPSGGRESA